MQHQTPSRDTTYSTSDIDSTGDVHDAASTNVAVVSTGDNHEYYEAELPDELVLSEWMKCDHPEGIMEWEVDRSDWSKRSRSASKSYVKSRARSPPKSNKNQSSTHCPPEVPVTNLINEKIRSGLVETGGRLQVGIFFLKSHCIKIR